MPLDPDTHERSDGATPNGGAYAIAYFRDADGKPCKKAEAHGTEIVEFDAADRPIHRTYLQRPSEPPPQESWQL